MKVTKKQPTSGSVFFLIFLAIGLFAAVSYAILQGGRVGSSSLTRDQARLAAQEIIAYGDAIANAVQTLRLRGCSDTQIDFSNHQGTSKYINGTLYTYNASAPSDGSCDVFNMNGGKVIPKLLSSGYVNPALIPAGWHHPQSFLFVAGQVMGVGTNSPPSPASDLVMYLGWVNEDVCVEINKQLGIPYTTLPLTLDASQPCGNIYNGTYTGCTNPIGDVATGLNGKTAFCNKLSAQSFGNSFIRVLIAR